MQQYSFLLSHSAMDNFLHENEHGYEQKLIGSSYHRASNSAPLLCSIVSNCVMLWSRPRLPSIAILCCNNWQARPGSQHDTVKDKGAGCAATCPVIWSYFQIFGRTKKVIVTSLRGHLIFPTDFHVCSPI